MWDIEKLKPILPGRQTIFKELQQKEAPDFYYLSLTSNEKNEDDSDKEVIISCVD